MLVNVRPPDPFNMASSGKKGKKAKGKTVPLNDFLLEGQAATIPIRKPASNWADEVEDVYESYDTRPKTNVVLPTAPKAARGLDDYSDKIPQVPPYIAYLSNLPYDVEEDEIAEFFGNLSIVSMRIPKGERPGEGPKLKGYGYVEFSDREGLIGALSITDCTLKNRRIRIEVSNSENDRKKGGRMDMGRDRGDRPEVSMGDWRSGPRSDPPESDRRQGGGGGGGGGGFSRERERDAPQVQERPGAWRDGPSFRDDKFNRDERDNRFNRDGDRRGFDRDGDRRGYNRDPERRGFTSRQDDRNGGFYRGGGGGGGGRDDIPSEKSESRQRPKLNLMPRTRPVEETSDSIPEKENEPVRPAPVSVPAASIFGSAKPVDTSARERQIEERLAKEHVKTDAPRDDRRRDDDRKRDGDRSPRRGSLERRKFSPRRGSPDRRRRTPERRQSPDRRRGSPIRRHGSPERRRGSGERRWQSPDRRGPSPDRRGPSPDRRRNSPERRRSPEGRRSPPVQRKGDWRGSSDRVKSPDLRKSSPERRVNSPTQKSISPDRKAVSPDRKKKSPERRKLSSDRNKSSEQKKTSPERTKGPARRNDGDKKGGKNEKPVKEKERQRREHPEMPKLKEPEAPNFVVSNVYAYLQTDSD